MEKAKFFWESREDFSVGNRLMNEERNSLAIMEGTPMKRFFSICLILTLLVGMIVLPQASATATGTQTAVVHGGWLRLRAQPSFDAETLTSYYTGTVVTVLQTTGSWSHVRTPDGRTGYMYSTYLSSSGSVGSGGGSTGGNATVWSGNGYPVRMRTGPSTGYRVVARYPVGTRVTVLERGSYWSRIQVGGLSGYMMNEFIRSNTPAPAPTPDPYGNARIWSANGYGVRLRTGPSTSHSIIGVYSVGTTVEVLVRNYTSGWDQIRVGTRTGYMMNEFLVYYGSTDVTNVTLNHMTPAVDAVLGALTITPAEASVNYLWAIGSREIGRESTYRVTAADIGQEITLTVTGTGHYRGSVSVTSNPVAATQYITSADVNVPVGTPAVVGDTVRAVGIQPEGASVAYQWYVDNQPVPSATGITYVVPDEPGKTIHVKVYGVSPFMGEAQSAPRTIGSSGQVTDASIVNTTNEGSTTPNIGDFLTATVVPSQATVTYQWEVRKVAGDTLVRTVTGNSTIQVLSGDIDCYVKLTVTGFGRYSNTVVKQTTGSITNLMQLKDVVLDPMNPRMGTQITATIRDANGSLNAAFATYRWFVNGVEVAGETSNTYVPRLTSTQNDAGKNITVRATAISTSGYSGTVTTTTQPVVGAYRAVQLDAPADVKTGDTLKVVMDPPDAQNEAEYKWEIEDWSEGSPVKRVVEGVELLVKSNYLEDAQSDPDATGKITLTVTPKNGGKYSESETETFTVSIRHGAVTIDDIVDLNGNGIPDADELFDIGTEENGDVPVEDVEDVIADELSDGGAEENDGILNDDAQGGEDVQGDGADLMNDIGGEENPAVNPDQMSAPVAFDPMVDVPQGSNDQPQGDVNVEPVIPQENVNTEPVIPQENQNFEPVIPQENINPEPVIPQENVNPEPVVPQENINPEPAMPQENVNPEPVIPQENVNPEPAMPQGTDEQVDDMIPTITLQVDKDDNKIIAVISNPVGNYRYSWYLDGERVLSNDVVNGNTYFIGADDAGKKLVVYATDGIIEVKESMTIR